MNGVWTHKIFNAYTCTIYNMAMKRFWKQNKNKCCKILLMNVAQLFVEGRMSYLRYFCLFVNVKEYWRGHQNEQSRETGNIGYTRRRKTKQKHNTKFVGHNYVQTNKNNANKTCVPLQTDDASKVLMKMRSPHLLTLCLCLCVRELTTSQYSSCQRSKSSIQSKSWFPDLHCFKSRLT
jgi:hypothetical protein